MNRREMAWAVSQYARRTTNVRHMSDIGGGFFIRRARRELPNSRTLSKLAKILTTAAAMIMAEKIPEVMTDPSLGCRLYRGGLDLSTNRSGSV